jgi:hypothetical protein
MDVASWTAEQWTAAGTIWTALVATAAAVFAWRQVGEARRLREAQAQPFILVTIGTSEHNMERLEVVVENIGQTLARDVSFTFTPELVSKLWEETPALDLNGSVLFTNGFPSMPPGMRVARVFEYADNRDPDDGLPWRYTVAVTFSDYRGENPQTLTYDVDLLPLTSGGYANVHGLHQIAENLKSLSSTLDSRLRSIAKT